MITPQELLQEYLDGIEEMKIKTWGEDKLEINRQADIFRSAIQYLDILYFDKKNQNIGIKKEFNNLNPQLRPAYRNGSKRQN